MGNEQSVSGDGENDSSPCQQPTMDLAAVSNGDDYNCYIARVPANNSSVTNVDSGTIPPKLAVNVSVVRQQPAASRTPTQSRSRGPTAAIPVERSPLSARSCSLRVRSHHHPPMRCASALDNVGAAASHQAKTGPSPGFAASNPLVSNDAPSTRSPRLTAAYRQRSAVVFSQSATGAAASGGANSLVAGMTASTTCGSTSTELGSEKSPTLASLLGLSAYQQQQISQSWPRIQQTGGHAAGAEIFRKLCARVTSIRESFQKVEVVAAVARARGSDVYKEHGRLLFEVFQAAVNSLNDPVDDLTQLCRGYGARHLCLRGEGFQTRMWDDLAELLVEHVTRLDAVRRHREVMRAWTAVIMFLVEKMKEGYDLGLRKSSQPVVATPLAHRCFGTGGSFAEEEPDAMHLWEIDGADYSDTVPTGRHFDRKPGPVRRDGQLEPEIEAEMRRLVTAEAGTEHEK